MKTRRKDTSRTRRRLLTSAGEMFATKGFHDTTIAHICKKAKTNVAAVNYHFGSKEKLYVEAWRDAFRRSITTYPPGGGVPPEAPPDQRLRGQIITTIRRMTDPKNHVFEIMHREFANPTGLLTRVVRQSLNMVRQELLGIVRELLGKEASMRDAELCEMSIMAQCFHVMARECHSKMWPHTGRPPGPPLLAFSVEAITDHIVRFSLAGIREIRRQTRSRQRGSKA